MNRREFLKGTVVGAVLPFAVGTKAAENLPVAIPPEAEPREGIVRQV